MVKATTTISIDAHILEQFKQTGNKLSTFIEEVIKTYLKDKDEIKKYKDIKDIDRKLTELSGNMSLLRNQKGKIEAEIKKKAEEKKEECRTVGARAKKL